MAMTAEMWSISGLAVELDMDRRTVAKRLEGVEPAGRRGRAKLFRMADAARACFAPTGSGGDDLDLTQESARLKKAQADKTELEVEIFKGNLLESEDVAEVWADRVLSARSLLLTIPPRLAMQMKAMADEPLPAIEDTIAESIHAALCGLAGGDPGESGGGGMGAAAKVKG